MTTHASGDHDRVERIVTALADTIRPLMFDAGFGKESCVAATRIGIDVLHTFGILASPLPMRFRVLNADMVTMLAADDADANAAVIAAHQRGEITKDTVGGPWVLDVNAPDVPEGGAGHVVIGIRSGNNWLVDLSADQVERRHKQIYINEPIVATPVHPDMFTTPGATMAATLPDGCRIEYIRVANRRYTSSPNWKRMSAGSGEPFRRVTAGCIAAINDQMD